jgi:hypothetical protein
MFITVEDIKDETGIDVEQQTLVLAQLMMETWVGKAEVEIDDAGDLETMRRATLFQALYIAGSEEVMLQQASVERLTIGESSTTFDTSRFAPYMSPWAVEACRRLSWTGPRTIAIGPMFDRAKEVGWKYE